MMFILMGWPLDSRSELRSWREFWRALLPAISSTGGAILSALQEGSRGIGGSAGRASLRKVLLTAEVALTVVLLITAGLLFKSFLRLRTCRPRAARRKTC